METLTAHEIETKLKGFSRRTWALSLLASPGQIVSRAIVDDILDYDLVTAAILERMVAQGICTCETNRWWPAQYRALNEALASAEFDKIRPSVRSRNTGAEIFISDPKSGNVVIIEIADPSAEAIRAAAKAAKNEMAARKRNTAARLAGERIVNAE